MVPADNHRGTVAAMPTTAIATPNPMRLAVVERTTVIRSALIRRPDDSEARLA